jgi:hypothetical protein
VKYNKRETLSNTTFQGEEISLLAVATKDEDEEEVWAEAKDK